MTNREKLLEKVDNVFKQTQVVIDGIAAGNRMQLKEMAEAVGIALSIEPKAIAHYVSDYAHNCSDGYVTRGKKGGFIKGARPVKSPKPVVVPAPPSPVLDSSADSSEEEST